jgi:hypothetical protein
MLTTKPSMNPPTLADLDALPPGIVGEIIEGVLYTMTKPRAGHQRTTRMIGGRVGDPFDNGLGGPGGWWTLGGQTLETMFLPKITWNGNALADVGVVSQQTGVFEEWMSSMMTAPTVGSLAGNVLTQFRVDLDYPEQKLYLSPALTR